MNALFEFLFPPKRITLTYPTYGEVLINLRSDIKKVFIAYEVLINTDCKNPANKNAIKLLRETAKSYNWDYMTFLDIVAEEYEIINVK